MQLFAANIVKISNINQTEGYYIYYGLAVA